MGYKPGLRSSSSLRPGLRAFKKKNGCIRDHFDKLNDTELKFDRLKGLIILKISKHNKYCYRSRDMSRDLTGRRRF